ncbi:MAG: response regulator [Candidatus Polarisedimenticolia bacterium]
MGIKVLVVDDSSVMRSIIIKTLRLSGLELESVLTAGNGREALLVLENTPVDLALVDINMPVMNGEELLDAVRAEPALEGLKMIVVSSDHTDARMERLAAKGVPIVHKPFNPATLKETIVKLTGAEIHDDGPTGELSF